MTTLTASASQPPLQPAGANPTQGVHIVRVGRAGWRLSAVQVVAADLESEVFPFFSRPENLEKLTPPMLRFRILTPSPIKMQKGAVIDYRIRVRGVPIRWRTLISAYEAPYRFVDEQIRGPYRLWRHEHTFTQTAEGTVCVDKVNYRPLGGAIMNRLFVERDLRRIFEFRQKILDELFGSGGS